MQCANTILSPVVCPALQNFSTLSHIWHAFWKRVIEHKMRVLIFSTTFVWNISHSQKKWEGDMNINLYCSSCKVPFILDFSLASQRKWNLSSSGILRSELWQFLTDVSVQPIFLFFKRNEDVKWVELPLTLRIMQ